MALPDLTGINIENSYQRVVHTDGTLYYDGTGSLLNIGGADTSSLLTTASFNAWTGSSTSYFAGTASYALTSSRAISASYALNGGVTQLLAGANITLGPTNGLGQVTISSTAGGGSSFNTATGSYGSFYDTTTQTNPVGNIPRSMSLDTTDITNGVSISGSTNPYNTYIKTENAGVYNIQFSAQVEKTDSGTDEIVIWLRKNGIDLTDTATTITLSGNNDKQVAAWNWFVTSAANDYYQIIWISADTGMRLLAETISGTHPGIPSVIVTANRIDQFLSNTGSFSGSFTGQFTGSLFGTSSFASTASFLNSTTNAFIQNGNSFGATALLGTNDNQSLALETSGSSRMFISSSGRISINKSSSNATLDINGSTLTSGSSTWVSPGFTNGYISPGSDGISIGNGNSGVHIRIRNSNRTNFDQSVGVGGPNFGQSTSDRITILTGGTTSGQTGLWVGSSANNNIFKVQGDSRVAINLATATSALHIQGTGSTSATAALTVQNSSTSASLVVLDNGFVGIRTTTPLFNLDISGSGRFTNNLTITGSLTVTGGITGSLLGTASFASTASIVPSYEDAWISYTPVWTANSVNPVIGNGTIEGYYKIIGKTCFVRGNIAMGSTTTFGSGEWYVSMPFTASHADAILMTAQLLDNSTAWYNATLNGARAGFNYKTAIQYQTSSGVANDVNATQPFTWTTSDRFLWNGSFEIA